MKLSVPVLTTAVSKTLQNRGVSVATADSVAEALVDADAAGVASHGVIQLRRYLDALEDGEVLANAQVSVRRSFASASLVSGGWGFGQPAMDYGTQLACRTADRNGIGLVSVVECYHTGRLGRYVEEAARLGYLMAIFGGGQGAVEPHAAPYGGRTRVLHTNPVAFGVPAGPSGPWVVDFATTVVSGGALMSALQDGRQLPPGSLVGPDGEPSSDPNVFFEGGAHAPFGGHKGYGLMLFAEAVSNILSDARGYASPPLGGIYLGESATTIIAIPSGVFGEVVDFSSTSEELAEKIRNSTPASGFDRVRVPGDLENDARRRSESGLEVADDVATILRPHLE